MLKFRTVDGSANNLADPTINSTGSDMIRIAPANFVTGTTTPIDGPNAREISNVVSSGPQAEAHDPTGLSAMMYVWGQFIDHDSIIRCRMINHIDITIPPGDPNFAAGNVSH